MKVTVVRAGPHTTVQDLGRFGLREVGVSAGGALDAHVARVANVIVGNAESTAGLEITLGPARLRFTDDRLIAWCGGEFDVRINATAIPAGHAAFVRPGDELEFGIARVGCRAWLAISGGIDVPFVLGSRSTDLRGGFGGYEGRRLRDGDVLSLGGAAFNSKASVGSWGAPAGWSQTAVRSALLRFVRGPDWSSFPDDALASFVRGLFVVTPEADRMGARLVGPNLSRTGVPDLVSAAVTPGTVQVPPSGSPIVLLGDCQTIGGYPKIAHVITVDLGVAAQLRPGDSLAFAEISIAEAHRLLLEREEEFRRFCVGVQLARAN